MLSEAKSRASGRTPTQTETAFLNRRRTALSSHPTQIGIDYIEVKEVSSDRWELWLYFVPAEDVTKVVVPRGITADNIRITGGLGVTQTNLRVEDVTSDEQNRYIRITVVQEGESEFPTYTLQLVNVSNVDAFFAQVDFSLKIDEPSEFDCGPSLESAPETLPAPEIDYLARDYSSFRQLMLDRLSIVMPQWRERNPADLGVALVETLAHAADYLSYYQDAVATEAYMGTARRRISVRRHARLLDYPMQQGCNARAWVQVQIEDGVNSVWLGKGTTQLMTSVIGQTTRLQPDSSAYDQALAQGPEVFETMHVVELFPAHNEIPFYTWGAREFILPRGATSATLKGHFPNLKTGDVLIFEEVRGPRTGNPADADPAHRHAVRLTQVPPSEDPLGGQLLGESGGGPVPIVEIEWHTQDALPFDLYISSVVAGKAVEDVSLARGNVVLIDHGRTITNEELLPPMVPENGRYRPKLRRSDITHRVPYNDDLARTQSAAAVILQNPREAIPLVSLHENGVIWSARRDLLSSDRFAREFVVEMENDERAHLRFGDGVAGKQPTPGTVLKATYRIGNGLEGNVGREAIALMVTDEPGIKKVRNPLPAQGGVDPEPIEQVRLYAPQAFRAQERAVTESDYAAAAQRHPEVQRAAAALRWTGSWHTLFITVDRVNNRPVDEAFKAELVAFLERFRLAGYDLEIRPPRFVPLDIALTVYVTPGHFRSIVHQGLLETFSNVDLPDGRRGFFHPDNFTFGQPVYLSQVVTTAVQVPGVAWVETTRFQRWGQPSRGELDEAQITVGPLEIARLDNNPDAPQNGMIAFDLEGGR